MWKKILEVSWDISQAKKNGFSHFMLKEIHDEPLVLKETISEYIKDVDKFFKGYSTDLIKDLTKKMYDASEELNFERALEYKKLIETCEKDGMAIRIRPSQIRVPASHVLMKRVEKPSRPRIHRL